MYNKNLHNKIRLSKELTDPKNLDFIKSINLLCRRYVSLE